MRFVEKIVSSGFLLVVFFVLNSCSNQNDGDTTTPLRDVQEVAIENKDGIIKFLNEYAYNYEDFQRNSTDFDYKIQFSKISSSSTRTLLKDQVVEKSIKIDDVDHSYYYVIVNQGQGTSPTVADSIYANYKGQYLDLKQFDSNIAPSWFDLLRTVRGFREFAKELKTGTGETGRTVNADGTINFHKGDYGVGFVIIPSRMGYFSGTSAIKSYSPLIFSLYVYSNKITDHDGDGILSIDEDVNRDGNPRNDNTDDDFFENYLDEDDDGDGTKTKDEYDANEDGVIDDTDQDGIPDYLDKT